MFTTINSYFSQMEIEYEQRTGLVRLVDSENGRALVARGYSGARGWVNATDAENRPAKGPLPRGLWSMGSAIQHGSLGPISIPLEPAGADTFGRFGFFIHGDNRFGDFSASRGCIILPRDARLFIAKLRELGLTTLRCV